MTAFRKIRPTLCPWRKPLDNTLIPICIPWLSVYSIKHSYVISSLWSFFKIVVSIICEVIRSPTVSGMTPVHHHRTQSWCAWPPNSFRKWPNFHTHRTQSWCDWTSCYLRERPCPSLTRTRGDVTWSPSLRDRPFLTLTGYRAHVTGHITFTLRGPRAIVTGLSTVMYDPLHTYRTQG